MSPTLKVAEFAITTRPEEMPASAIHGAKLTILDSLGVGLAAVGQPTAAAVLEYVRSLGGSPVAAVLGTAGLRTAPAFAALANGCLINMLDYDGYHHMPTHVLPAALAVGELVHATGQQLLEAFIIGAEVAYRFNEVIDGPQARRSGPTRRGWYHLSIYGPIAAALVASRLLGLDVGQARAAVGNAACSSGGVRRNLGTTAKSLAAGNSAAAGVQAALLARSGVAGGPDILEARLGLINALCLPGESDWAPLVERLGSPYHMGSKLDYKAYPAVSPTHPVIKTLQLLQQAQGFQADDVQSVDAELSTFSATAAYAEDTLSAGFSWPYILAAVLLDGTFGAVHLTEERVRDPRYRRYAERIRIRPLPMNDDPQKLTITLHDGRVLEAPIELRSARIEEESVVIDKYRACAGLCLAPSAVERLYDQVMGLEKLGSLAELTDTLQTLR